MAAPPLIHAHATSSSSSITSPLSVRLHPSTGSLEIPLPQFARRESYFSLSDPSIRHDRLQASFLLTPTSFASSPRRPFTRRSISGGYQDFPDDTVGGLQPFWQTQYCLRPARTVRTMSNDPSPGGTCRHVCAALEQSGQLGASQSSSLSTGYIKQRVRMPTEAECAICFEALRSGEQVQPMVHCSHLFHKRCIDSLIQARIASGSSHFAPEGQSSEMMTSFVTCPLCRGQMLAQSHSEVPDVERAYVQPLADVMRYGTI
eukprot:TRINITY_DN69478_c0_g1_i1.p1 TRINITY_DN69478_c0_g1~~TRINITY_DN69478_c0_g1_i1.p1  ORF type:complete len:288 (+),score=27.26 TRINITY_DN69478_c0_g1_i1:87-866(+)